MTQFRLSCIAVAAAAVLVACGGSDDAPRRGELLEAPLALATLTAAQIDDSTAQSGLQAISGRARCDVKVVALNYATAGVRAGEQTNASGVLLVPVGACTGPAPLVAYARGTEVDKPHALANPQDGETFLLAAMYAAQGYAVVASDYLGFARSDYPYHPYLHADSEATTVLDAVRAARAAAPSVGASLSGKLMLTGYSQGGHAAMAAHRAAEQGNPNEFKRWLAEQPERKALKRRRDALQQTRCKPCWTNTCRSFDDACRSHAAMGSIEKYWSNKPLALVQQAQPAIN